VYDGDGDYESCRRHHEAVDRRRLDSSERLFAQRITVSTQHDDAGEGGKTGVAG